MARFDCLIGDLLLTAPASGILPGVNDPSIDNVAWHDFSSYEFLHEPVYYEPPASGGSGGGGGGGDGVIVVPGDCHDWCPGPDPWVLCVARDVVNQLDDLQIARPELERFLLTVSRTVNYAISRQIGLKRGSTVPDFAHRAKAAYESAILQGGYLSRLYEAYLSIPSTKDRDRVFLSALGGWFDEPCAVMDVTGGGWAPPLPLPTSVFQTIETLVGHIEENIAYGARAAENHGGTTVAYSLQALTSSLLSDFYKNLTFFEPNSTNLGLQLVYRQEWRLLGVQRGEIVRTLPLGPRQSEKISTKALRRNKVQRTAESLRAVESTTEVTDTSKDSTDVVNETVETSGWNAEAGGSFSLGGFGINASGGANESISNKVASTNTFLLESVQKTANRIRMESKMVVSSEGETAFETTVASEIQNPNDEIAVTYVYSKLQRQYDVFTHLNEVNTVVFIAEEFPASDNALRQWIKDNDWIIARVLLDDSFRDALSAMNQDLPQEPIDNTMKARFDTAMDTITASGGVLRDFANRMTNLSLEHADLTQEIQRSMQQIYKEKDERTRSAAVYQLKVDRLVEHVRKYILHYCRAVWSQEDSDQRMLRYKKLGMEVPTVWEFVSGSGTVDLATLLADPSLLLDGEWQPVAGSERPVADVINPAGPIGYHGNYAVFYAKPDLRLADANVFDVLDLMRQPYIDNSDPPGFLDPARAYIEAKHAGNVPNPIPDGTKEEMLRLVPELRAQYEAIPEDAVDPNTGASMRQIFFDNNANFTQEYYFDYLFRKQFTRQLVVDTNNLVVDIEVGTGSTLEGFKRMHRCVDVQKADAEREKLDLENERLRQRLAANELGDPDIENMTILTGEIKGDLRDHGFPPGHDHHHGDHDDD